MERSVLDFGLAKATDTATSSGRGRHASPLQDPTITSPALTMQGMILGTAAYMAPEQAKGKPVDKRADNDVAEGRWLSQGRMLIETGNQLCMSGDCCSIGVKAPDAAAITPLVSGWGGDVSSDGRTLAYSARGDTTEWDFFLKPMDAPGRAARSSSHQSGKWNRAFHPIDGFSLTCPLRSDRRRYGWPASAAVDDGRCQGRWVLRRVGRLMGASCISRVAPPSWRSSLRRGPPPSFGTPLEIFPNGTLLRAPVLRHVFGFDVSRDGRRFVVPKAESVDTPLNVELLYHWSVGLEGRPSNAETSE